MRFEMRARFNHLHCSVLVVFLLLSAAGAARAADTNSSYPPTATMGDIEQRIRECRKDHPRLFATRRQLEQLAATSANNPLRKKLAAAIVAQAKSLLDAKPVERTLEGRRLLSVSRMCLDRVTILATAYYLTNDTRYADRCQTEMLAAARFTNWNPSHYLDVAEMTTGLAIGYDWLYDRLDSASRAEIRQAIVEKGVQLQFDPKHDSWVHRDNNWGQVCHGGMTVGALAVLEDEPELAAKTVHSALHNVTKSMAAYAPRGGYPEGPSYWGYGTSYNVALIAALESVLGSDFGLSSAPGFRETAAFPDLTCGPSGLYFDYADGHAERLPSAPRFWFASRIGRNELIASELPIWEKVLSNSNSLTPRQLGRFAPLMLIWMSDNGGTSANKLPLNWSSGGKVPIAVHRSSWTERNATFIGLKAGSPAQNHGHMDIGSFVFDSDSVRWAVDLGAEGYYGVESRGMGLWDRDQDGDRWTIFRLSNLSHNTLVIDGQLQHADGDAPMEQFSDDPTHPYSIVDMTQVYEGQVTSARRGIALLPSREVIIQDELTGLRPGSRIRWGMVTPGVPENLGKKDVVLRQGGKQLKLSIVTPKTKGWTQVETEKPPHEWDSPNPGTRMVAFEAPAPPSGKMALVVGLTPGSCEKPVASKRPIVPLQDWNAR